jgi:restriction endonuclease S subunit
MSDTTASDWEWKLLSEVIRDGQIGLGRGDVISKIDIENHPGDYPIYSSSASATGMFGRYGKYMFDEELITWSVDGGGKPFYRPKHKFSVTNVCGFLKIKDIEKWDYRFVAALMQEQHRALSFDWLMKAHPSVIRNLYRLPILPIREQQRIAEILDAVDSKIRSTEGIIEKLHSAESGMTAALLAPALSAARIGGETTSASLPPGWITGPLGAFCTLQRGFDITQAEQRDGPYPVISSSGITSHHDRFMVDGPGVVTGRKGSLGGVYYCEGPFWPHDTSLWVKDFHGNDPHFIALLLKSLRLERFDAATSVPTLNRNTVHPLCVAVPTSSQQQDIVSALKKFTSRAQVEEARLSKLGRIRLGLLSDLLTGGVRVPVRAV